MIQAVPDPRPERPEEEESQEAGAAETGAVEAEDVGATDGTTPAPGADAEPDGDDSPVPDFVARTFHLPRRVARRLDVVARALEREPSEIVAAALDAQLDRLVDGSDAGDRTGPETERPGLRVFPVRDGAPRPDRDAPAPADAPKSPVAGKPHPTGADSLPANGQGHTSSADGNGDAPSAGANGHSLSTGGAEPTGGSEAMVSCLEALGAAASAPLDAAAVRRAAARILKSLDRRQPNALEHAQAVARLAFRLGTELGLDDLDVETAELAGLLHDIGKLEVPVEILQKRGALTSKEWQLVRGYPEWGARALERLEGFDPLVPLVRYHKETWDGRGYPHGLEGEDIPLGAQVIGIADAFHTMLSPRPYRPALSLEQAHACVQDNVGTFWAPAVAEALLAIASNGHQPD